MSKEKNNLTDFEKQLLENLNFRANKLIKIEEISKNIKMPVNMDYINSLSDEKLDDALEMYMNLKSFNQLKQNPETNI